MRAIVGVYIRESNPQRYVSVKPKQQYAEGTVFYLRYRTPAGQRVWEPLHNETLRCALAAARLKEAALLRATPSDAGESNSQRSEAIRRKTLMVLREEFLEQKRLTKKKDGTRLDKETLSAYENLIAEFLRITKAAYALRNAA